MSETDFNFEELITLTNESKANKNRLFTERLTRARNDAVLHITENAYDKMKESAKNGFSRATLYSFSWAKDPNSRVDENGVKIMFDGDIRLLDLINKDHNDFFNVLNAHFNKDTDKFHCGVSKNGNIWNIYVSWETEEKRVESRKSNAKSKDKYVKKAKAKANTL